MRLRFSPTRGRSSTPSAPRSHSSKILGGPAKGYLNKLGGDSSYVWVKRKITPEQKKRIEALRLDGLGFVTESRRFYPKRDLASSLLGFVGVDDGGMYGLEQSYQRHVSGRVGRIRVERDAKGRSVLPEVRVLVPPRPGADVRLTIDEVLQYVVETELRDQLDRVGAKRAIGVMVEPGSGRILALASVPGFNPNAYHLYRASAWKEPAVQEFYEPGSTFKIITAAAYLEAGKSLDKKYFAENGAYRVRGRYVLHDHKKFGELTAGGSDSQLIEHRHLQNGARGGRGGPLPHGAPFRLRPQDGGALSR